MPKKTKLRDFPFTIKDSMGFRKRLIQRRTKLGLSTRELAFPGCSYSYITRIENGERVPTLEIVQGLAERLGVSAAWLLTGKESDAWQAVALQIIAEYRNGVVPPKTLIDRLEKYTLASNHDGNG